MTTKNISSGTLYIKKVEFQFTFISEYSKDLEAIIFYFNIWKKGDDPVLRRVHLTKKLRCPYVSDYGQYYYGQYYY